jgi:hypothetical protein
MGWHWHLDDQAAGRSQGQIPHATLHDFHVILPENSVNVKLGMTFLQLLRKLYFDQKSKEFSNIFDDEFIAGRCN